MKAKIFLAVAAIVGGFLVVNAQDAKQTPAKPQNGPVYVDKNNNGTCDNYENGTSNGRRHNGNGCGHGKGAKQGKGNGQGQGKHNGQGSNFVDKNGNGTCDNYEARNTKK